MPFPEAGNTGGGAYWQENCEVKLGITASALS